MYKLYAPITVQLRYVFSIVTMCVAKFLMKKHFLLLLNQKISLHAESFSAICVFQVEESVLFINLMYTIPIQIIITIYFVYTYISYAAFVGKFL